MTHLLKIESYTVPVLPKKIRLQDFGINIFKTITSKSALKKAIKQNLVHINCNIAATGDFLIGGEIIDLYQNPKVRKKPSIEITLKIIYEDDYLAIVHKPPGITVSGNKKWTLENALAHNLKQSTQADGLMRPEPIHRLDHPTSGVLLIGKTSQSVIALNKLFENREIQKVYFAIAIGSLKEEGIITTPIDLKESQTDYIVRKTVVSERFGYLNLVELIPCSGRKHQLRKHLSELGNPILGDKEYGKEDLILKGNGLYLHAYSLKFTHPFSKETILASSSLPDKFESIFKNSNN